MALFPVLTAAFLLASNAIAQAAEIPVNTVAPSIAGTPKPGQTLTALAGSWTGQPTEYRYRWEYCPTSGGACRLRGEFSTQATYVVSPYDTIGALRVQVEAVNEAGTSDPAVSALVDVKTNWEFVHGKPQVGAAHWHAARCCRDENPSEATKTLRLEIDSGFCVGEPKPVVDHVAVVERPLTAKRRFKSAIVTAFVRFPAPLEIVGTVNAGEPVPGCADLGLGLVTHVKLKRPVARLFLFDGSHSPPRLILKPHRRRR